MRRPPGDELKRYAAPAAVLVAVTIAVLLVHNGLQSGGDTTTAPSIPGATATTATTTATRSTSTSTTAAAAQFYTVQTGDTLGSIAEKYDTSVQLLQGLNPDVDPAALQPGQKIRVK